MFDSKMWAWIASKTDLANPSLHLAFHENQEEFDRWRSRWARPQQAVLSLFGVFATASSLVCDSRVAGSTNSTESTSDCAQTWPASVPNTAATQQRKNLNNTRSVVTSTHPR